MKFPTSWGCSIANSIGVSEDNYVCAAGHYAQPDLLMLYAKGLNFNYIRVNTKEEYLSGLDQFISTECIDHPMILEMVVNSEDEDIALSAIGSIMVAESNVAKATIKKMIGKKRINAIKKMIRR